MKYWTDDELEKLNSLTKYPSIYRPWSPVQEGKKPYFIGDLIVADDARDEFSRTSFEVTEKLDGTNVRIIYTNQGWFIGNRNELLQYSEDVLCWDKDNILETVKPYLPDLLSSLEFALQHNGMHRTVVVAFGEVLGDRIGKRYRGMRRELRTFDWRVCPRPDWPSAPNDIQRWRQTGQGFLRLGYDSVREHAVPHLGGVKGEQLLNPREAFNWLVNLGLSDISDKYTREGVVIKKVDSEYCVLPACERRVSAYVKKDDNSVQRYAFKIKFDGFPREWQQKLAAAEQSST